MTADHRPLTAIPLQYRGRPSTVRGQPSTVRVLPSAVGGQPSTVKIENRLNHISLPD